MTSTDAISKGTALVAGAMPEKLIDHALIIVIKEIKIVKINKLIFLTFN